MPNEIEIKIVRALNKNARKSFREIAKEVGISVPAVIHRVKKMEKAGAIKGYIPILDHEYFGFPLMAVIAVRISQGKHVETMQKIAEDAHTFYIYDVTGEWDAFVIAHFEGSKELQAFITEVLAAHKYVVRTVTHIGFKVIKDERRVVI